jgi:hypothetical protein
MLDGAHDDAHSRMVLSAKARSAIAGAVQMPMRHYCGRERKRIYCDKSLDSVYHLSAVHEVFPQTRSILLFRHVMDTVASGLEASPWGFASFGYLPFVQRSPDNLVAALANYWVAHVDAALRWEAQHPLLCHRVRYEDLVADPAAELGRISDFLEVAHDSQLIARALARARTATGPAIKRSASLRPSIGPRWVAAEGFPSRWCHRRSLRTQTRSSARSGIRRWVLVGMPSLPR